MPIYRERIFRPLLVFTEIERQAILQIENWKLFEDESNLSDSFLRNRIRKTILPLLKQEGLNPNKLHENFHNKDILFWDETESLIQEVIPSFLKIDKNSLIGISPGNLKLVLDAHANIVRIHPFTKNILFEIKKELDKKASFLIENKEVILWKNPSSDLYLLPTKSPVLQKPKLIQKDKKVILHWNGKTKEISFNFQVDFWKKGLNILRNGKHHEVSELLREKQIPTPVRKFIPILFKEKQACSILFSLWDDRFMDFKGDLLINEIR